MASNMQSYQKGFTVQCFLFYRLPCVFKTSDMFYSRKQRSTRNCVNEGDWCPVFVATFPPMSCAKELGIERCVSQ